MTNDETKAQPGPRRRTLVVLIKIISVPWSLIRQSFNSAKVWAVEKQACLLYEFSLLVACIVVILMLGYLGKLLGSQLIPDLAGYLMKSPIPPAPIPPIVYPSLIVDPETAEPLPPVLEPMSTSPESLSLFGQVRSGIQSGVLQSPLPHVAGSPDGGTKSVKDMFLFVKKSILAYNSRVEEHNRSVMVYRRRFLLYQSLNVLLLSLLLFLTVRPMLSIGSVYVKSMPERETALAIEDAVKKGIVSALRERARRSRMAAILVLVLVLISLVSGLAFFVFAGAIASREVRGRVAERAIDLEQVYLAQRGVSPPLVPPSDSGPSVAAPVPMLPHSGLVDLDGPPRIGPISDKAKDEITEKLKKLDEQNQSLYEALRGYVSNSLATRETIASLSTRVGSIFILLFLVQILVSLYRYNVRLASYYDARADALQLAGDTKSEEFFKLVLALSPEHLEFGRSRTPVSEITRYAREFTSGDKDSKKE